MAKINCWEFKKCANVSGTHPESELGKCPVANATKADGVNEGKNGGRICWAIAGTLCGGKVQGSFAHKIGNCLKCEFYIKVKEEEGLAKFKLGL